MSKLNEAQERAAFEAEMRKRWGEEHFAKRETPFDGLCYDSQSMSGAWAGWQAARRAAAAQPVEAASAPADVECLRCEGRGKHAYVEYGVLRDSKCKECGGSGRKPSGAPPGQTEPGEMLSVMLWLYRRLPRCYGRPPHIEHPIKALAKVAGIDVDACLAERDAGAAPAKPVEGSACS